MAPKEKAAPIEDLQDYPLDDTPAKVEARKALAADDPAKYDPTVNPLNPKLQRSHKPKAIRVEAIGIGYYGDALRRVGDVFTVNSEREYSARWMKRVPASTPGRQTGSAAALQQEHDANLKAKLTGGTTTEEPPTGDENPLELS